MTDETDSFWFGPVLLKANFLGASFTVELRGWLETYEPDEAIRAAQELVKKGYTREFPNGRKLTTEDLEALIPPIIKLMKGAV